MRPVGNPEKKPTMSLTQYSCLFSSQLKQTLIMSYVYILQVLTIYLCLASILQTPVRSCGIYRLDESTLYSFPSCLIDLTFQLLNEMFFLPQNILCYLKSHIHFQPGLFHILARSSVHHRGISEKYIST